MIVKCVRCHKEFSSTHAHSHVCPSCHLVFEEDTPKYGAFEIVRSHDLAKQKTDHSLLDEEVEKCSFHPDVDAVDHCKTCGRPVCYVCAHEGESGCTCEPCAEGAEPLRGIERRRSQPDEERESREGQPERRKASSISQVRKALPYVAWEYRDQIGRFHALSLTWQQTLFAPIRFFRSVPLVGDSRGPLLYGICWTLAGMLGGVVWKLLFANYPRIAMFLEGQPIDISIQLTPTYLVTIALLLLSPLLALGLLVTGGALYHISVWLLTRQHAGFTATLKVICYSSGANIFLLLPPVLAAPLWALWQLVLVTTGLRGVHRISFLHAFVIAIIPYAIQLAGLTAFIFWILAGNRLGLSELVPFILPGSTQ